MMGPATDIRPITVSSFEANRLLQARSHNMNNQSKIIRLHPSKQQQLLSNLKDIVSDSRKATAQRRYCCSVCYFEKLIDFTLFRPCLWKARTGPVV
jgi:hypothetical protein